MAEEVSNLVNIYRITGDDWDTWRDVETHFNVSRDFAAANMIGANGLKGNSWPDLDMLPLGWLTDPGVQMKVHTENVTELLMNKELRDEEMIHKQQYNEKFHLLSTDDKELCLVDSVNLCTIACQLMWEFNLNGTLTSSYSGQCAVLKKAKAKVESGGIRCWIATGRRGEIYVSFFNLSAEKTVISAKISDLTKAFPSRNLRRASCKYREV
ncbi:hypothetical protein GIB67_032291 [Kingdonia uniflora]|uniref:Alpha-galactosidase n=1 Tax=Kingdonia uniflora TaxID=39325 RepID=A0A7J7MXL0_9MAGN|nr:hypothetical protein GIB67_032291 [Kingdonia uniflora]